MSNLISVIHILSDGRFHSGESIGKSLEVSRAAVWKSILKIRDEWQIDVQSVKGKGYRIQGGLKLLDENKIKSLVSSAGYGKSLSLEILSSVESSNQYLMKKTDASNVQPAHVVIAEHQTAGRGRRGRVWQSPFAQNLYVSVLWKFIETTSGVSGLSLVVAIAILRVLKQAGITDAGLKWPNDIHWNGKKLCGILLEMKGEASGSWNIIIGIGLNVNMSKKYGKEINQDWTSLQNITGNPVDRNGLVADVIRELFAVLEQFSHTGLSGFLNEWNENDLTLNQSVKLHTAQDTVIGIARGIDDQGALLLEVNGGIEHYHAGEVSLRYNELVC